MRIGTSLNIWIRIDDYMVKFKPDRVKSKKMMIGI